MLPDSSTQQINQIPPTRPTSFLKKLATSLLAQHSTDLSGVVVVLPNSRGGAYLKQELITALHGKPALLPAILSMDEFVRRLVSERVVDNLEAQMILFQSFRAIRNEEEAFETFFPLGQMLLSDFEEITRNQKPIHLIYRNLAEWEATGISFSDFLTEEQKELLEQFWSHFSEDKITALRVRFIQLWKKLPEVFADFTKRLGQRNECTSAMAYAQSTQTVSTSPWVGTKGKIWFAGFGDLSESEKQLIASVQAMGKLELVWDFNSLFSENRVHEVSRLIARLQRTPVFVESIQKALAENPILDRPVIQTVYCQGYAGMADWLKEKAGLGGNTSTAYVLTDPGMVHTLIQQTNFEEEKYNFTMGYPLSYTGMVAWINRILTWCERERRNEIHSLEGVLEHPMASKLMYPAANQWEKWEGREAENAGDPDVLKQKLSFAPTWLWADDAKSWLPSFREWWDVIVSAEGSTVYEQGTYPKISAALAHLSGLIDLLEPEPVSWKTVRLLWTPILYQHSLAIEGSMKEGIQVLGLYETRVLDFDEVVVAPAEEGKIPTLGKRQTFLTENLRKAFGLPTQSQQVEDELYQFYRLCYRSSRVTLLVAQSADTKPSRILNQLRYSSLFDCEEIHQQYGHSLPLAKEIRVDKNEAIASWISRYYRENNKPEIKSLSPSFLHNLLNCSLKAYFKGFERLEEPNQTKALEMSPKDFGNWVHGCVQELYREQQKTGQFLSPSDYAEMKEKWETVQYLVWNDLPNKETHRPLSDYRIEKEVGKVMAFRFLEFMATQKPHEWKANEQLLTRAYLETENLPGKEWAIEGRADLVLETETEHWIIDLKTGSFSEPKEYWLSLNKLDKLESKCKSNKDIFQMLVYNWLNTKAHPEKKTKTQLFYMANPVGEFVDPLQNVETRNELEAVHNELEKMLGKYLESWCDRNEAILQTEDMQVCDYCEFQAICQR